MKIIATENALIIRHKPLLFYGFCAVFLCMGVGSLLFPTVVVSDAAYDMNDRQLFGQVFGLALCLPAFLLMFFPIASAIEWRFESCSDTLIEKKVSLRGTCIVDYPFEKITEVKIDAQWDQGLYGIQILLSEGTALHFCTDYSLTTDVAQDGVNRIKAVLGDRF